MVWCLVKHRDNFTLPHRLYPTEGLKVPTVAHFVFLFSDTQYPCLAAVFWHSFKEYFVYSLKYVRTNIISLRRLFHLSV
jgi:hypothetical protein